MAGLSPIAAMAQTNPAVPTRPQVEPSQPPQAAPNQPNVSREAEAIAACPLAGSTVQVTINAVRFAGPADAPLPPVITEVLGSGGPLAAGPTSIAVVCDIRDRAAAALQQAGYIASVQIPAQEITDGTLRLTVVTARITEIRVRGEVGRYRALIEKRVAAIKALDPLNQKTAERILLLANDVPGLSLRLALRPAGTAPGEVIGELTADLQRLSLLANVQNSGSRQLGREVVTIRAELFGVTGLADRTFVALSNTVDFDETHVIQAGHDIGIGGKGLRVGVRGSFALSNPDIPDFDLNTRSLVAGLDVTMPVIRALNHNLRLATGFELLDQRTVIRGDTGDTPFSRDRIRVAFARVEADARILSDTGAEVWRVDGYVEARKGLNILGASTLGRPSGGFSPSRFDGDPQATVIRGELIQTLRPVPFLALGGAVYGQWANRALLNFEEFALGNLTYGRGYDPGSNGGDRVIAGRIEPRVLLPIFSRIGVEAMGFFDIVRLNNLDRGTLETNRTLKSAGGGVRLTVPGRIVLDVTYAKPLDLVLLTDEVKPKARVLVSLTTKILPWKSRP